MTFFIEAITKVIDEINSNTSDPITRFYLPNYQTEISFAEVDKPKLKIFLDFRVGSFTSSFPKISDLSDQNKLDVIQELNNILGVAKKILELGSSAPS